MQIPTERAFANRLLANRSHVPLVTSPAGIFNRLWWSKSEFQKNGNNNTVLKIKVKRALLFLCLQYLNPLHRLVTETCVI